MSEMRTYADIYVLGLEDGCYYIERSNDMDTRIKEHFKGRASNWTKKHRPIKIVKIYYCMNPFDEEIIMSEYVAQYGIDKVRGGSYITNKHL